MMIGSARIGAEAADQVAALKRQVAELDAESRYAEAPASAEQAVTAFF
ncbi:MAG: hypothetical protein WBP94_17440 [Rhodomicrobiaceae bacterium]